MSWRLSKLQWQILSLAMANRMTPRTQWKARLLGDARGADLCFPEMMHALYGFKPSTVEFRYVIDGKRFESRKAVSVDLIREYPDGKYFGREENDPKKLAAARVALSRSCWQLSDRGFVERIGGGVRLTEAGVDAVNSVAICHTVNRGKVA